MNLLCNMVVKMLMWFLLCQVLHIHSCNYGPVIMVDGHSVTNVRHIASVFKSGAMIIDSKESNSIVACHIL